MVSRLGGHSEPRTHRSKNGGKFPGMEITYALMQRYEAMSEEGKCKLIVKARSAMCPNETNKNNTNNTNNTNNNTLLNKQHTTHKTHTQAKKPTQEAMMKKLYMLIKP